jgi:hypothetical protein
MFRRGRLSAEGSWTGLVSDRDQFFRPIDDWMRAFRGPTDNAFRLHAAGRARHNCIRVGK